MTQVSDWTSFYLMAGDAIGALVGLLFVAMSLHLREILAQPALTRQVAIALGGLVFALLFCGFMLAPGVTVPAVGALTIVGAGAFAFAYARSGSTRARGIALGISLADVAVGIALAFGWAPALYLLAGGIGLEVSALVRLCWRLLTLAVSRE